MQAQLNLFSTADANAEALSARFRALRDAGPEEDALRLSRFADHVYEKGRISINMPMSVLEWFLSRGEYLNVHEVVSWEATHSSKSPEQLLQERLPVYYERRVAFDRSLERGEEFRYGFLSIGGPGATAYGEFCVVFQDSFPAEKPSEFAYLPMDSLKGYLLPGPMLDQETLRHDVAPHSHRHCLAALKHASEVCDLLEDHWPAMMCSAEEYIEAIFLAPPKPRSVEVVRIPRINFETYYYFAFEEARGRLSTEDRHLADDFKSIVKLLEESALMLEDV